MLLSGGCRRENLGEDSVSRWLLSLTKIALAYSQKEIFCKIFLILKVLGLACVFLEERYG